MGNHHSVYNEVYGSNRITLYNSNFIASNSKLTINLQFCLFDTIKIENLNINSTLQITKFRQKFTIWANIYILFLWLGSGGGRI